MVLDGSSLTIREIAGAARSAAPVRVGLDPVSVVRMEDSVRVLEKRLAEGVPVYGVTTGFGDSSHRRIAVEDAAELQRNLIRYHLNGVGPLACRDVVRATMLIRANSLARGDSAIRPEVVDLLLGMVLHDVVPRVPERGSLGASGDLVPLCYIAAALMGEGDVDYRGSTWSAVDALIDAGLNPIALEAKEGLALINGTSFAAAFAALAVADAEELAFAADLVTAMASEAILGNRAHFDEFLFAAKPHRGSIQSAELIRRILSDSRLARSQDDVTSARCTAGEQNCSGGERVQDNYSIRCAPHVTGVLWDTLEWASRWVAVEVNSSTDNPLFDSRAGTVHHGGNFYAGHVGQAMDSLKIAAANVADLLDRQLALVVDPRFSRGLPANLVGAEAGRGVHHGFKGMQIACSAVTAEALKEAGPAGIFSRSSESHNQDKVSMGTIAARGARTVLELTAQVAAIHLLAVAQALELRGLERVSSVSRRVHGVVRECARFVSGDRRQDGDIESVAQLLLSGRLRAVVAETSK
nr:aromatic amino acid ammonia-lyase [Lentzea albidocapillata]